MIETPRSAIEAEQCRELGCGGKLGIRHRLLTNSYMIVCLDCWHVCAEGSSRLSAAATYWVCAPTWRQRAKRKVADAFAYIAKELRK